MMRVMNNTPRSPKDVPKERNLFTIFVHARKRKIAISRVTFGLSVGLVTLVFGALLVSVTLFVQRDTQLEEMKFQMQQAISRSDLLIEEVGRVAAVASEVDAMIDTLSSDSDDTVQLVTQDVPERGISLFTVPVSFRRRPTRSYRNELEYIGSVLENSKTPFQDIVSILNSQSGLLSDIPSIWPLQNNHGHVTLEFGPNRHPKTNQWYLHKGIDIAGAYGVKVLASANGKVIEAGYDGTGYGNYVLLRHKYGFRTRYSHLSNIYASEGEDVLQHEPIGTLGNTGISTGPHLDFQIILGTDVIDPAQFLKISRRQFQRWSGNR